MVFNLIELQGCVWQGFPAAMAEQVVGILRSESPSNNDSRKQRREMLQELFSFSCWELNTGARFTWSGRKHLN